jgi:hypothetical protein
MVKKTVGYVRLEWTCPNCGTRNPGPQKTCVSCGSPQPEDIEFEQPAQEKLIKDEAEITQAKKGPDIHCYYCGTRNPADAKTCSQCGADLSEGAARKTGQVVGAHRTGPVENIPCPSCGSPIHPDAPKCPHCGASTTEPRAVAPPARPAKAQAIPAKRMNPLIIVGVVAVLLAFFACCGYLFFSTDDTTATVQSVAWQRSIGIEGLVPVEHENWENEIPAGAVVGVCTQKVHHTQDTPDPNAKEVCGTPYTVDTGTGYGEVVQDCQYQVYADWCKYTVDEWKEVDQISLNGANFNPRWPDKPLLISEQREGQRKEEYTIVFDAGSKNYTYTTSKVSLFNQCQIGSRWTLKINKIGGVVDIEPAR